VQIGETHPTKVQARIKNTHEPFRWVKSLQIRLNSFKATPERPNAKGPGSPGEKLSREKNKKVVSKIPSRGARGPRNKETEGGHQRPGEKEQGGKTFEVLG